MSGRDHEPVSAFFPAIDRNLMLELDRHLRGASREDSIEPAPSAEVETAAPQAAAQANPHGRRPDVTHVVEAVEQAGHSIAAMAARIADLETHIENLETDKLHHDERLAAAQQQIDDLNGRLVQEGERATRIEAVAAQQAGRAAALDRELSAAHDDLARITDAIAATLGFPQRF